MCTSNTVFIKEREKRNAAMLEKHNGQSSKEKFEILGELVCDGVGTYQISKARTVVGRNSQTADLAIQSSNHVSRQHIEVPISYIYIVI